MLMVTAEMFTVARRTD